MDIKSQAQAIFARMHLLHTIMGAVAYLFNVIVQPPNVCTLN